ncbi:MAG: TatD family hydrolase [Spirochaetales bacterium]|nr:TatD family hydrolase [Spirochaetales bacterium]MCF7937542.1 TatD family hydrolase [Spirochaetales bacterium]
MTNQELPLADPHFHILEMQKKELNIPQRLDEAFEILDLGIDIATNEEGFDLRTSFDQRYPNLYHTVGLSHYEAAREPASQNAGLEVIKRQASSSKVVAVGEIGLDYHHNAAPPKDQKKLFAKQLELAHSLDLPVVIHNRNADEDVYEILESHDLRRRGIIHCFSSDRDTALRFYELGYLISFAGNLTFKNASALRAAAQALPPESFIVETDAPYLSPEPNRGRPNHPAQVKHTYQYLADLRGLALQDLAIQIRSNIRDLLGV